MFCEHSQYCRFSVNVRSFYLEADRSMTFRAPYLKLEVGEAETAVAKVVG